MSQFVYALALGGLGIELDGNRSAAKDGGVGFGQVRPGRKCCKQLCFSLVNNRTSRMGFVTFFPNIHTLCGMKI